jgi:hypothetical protein
MHTLSKQRIIELTTTEHHHRQQQQQQQQQPMINDRSTPIDASISLSPSLSDDPQSSSDTATHSKYVTINNTLNQSYSYDPLAKYREEVILHHLNLVDKAGLGCDTSVTHVH